MGIYETRLKRPPNLLETKIHRIYFSGEKAGNPKCQVLVSSFARLIVYKAKDDAQTLRHADLKIERF